MRVFLQRWVYLVLGGALFTPYALLAMLALPIAVPGVADLSMPVLLVSAAALSLVAIAVSSLVPFVRTLEVAAIAGLLGGHAAHLVYTPARTPGAKLRNGVWYLAHTCGGAVISLGTVIGVPVALALLASPWRSGSQVDLQLGDLAVDRTWGVPVALALLVGLVVLVALSGKVAAWLAPILLGPDPVARLEELERRSSALTERNRLAQELHDSMGHALTITTLQAGAARKVLSTDPVFAAQALDAIERTGRMAAADLDNFLGLLRDEGATRAPQPTLHDLDALVASHREAGLPVTLEIEGDLSAVAGTVSREVYRIVQEGLTNVQRHAGNVTTSVCMRVDAGRLVVQVRNAAGRHVGGALGGGRGLTGMRERVGLLGGELVTGPVPADRTEADCSGWLLEARVPSGAHA